MAKNNIEVTYHYNNKDLFKIIKKLANVGLSIDKEVIEKDSKQSLKRVYLFSKVFKCNECGGNMCYREGYKGYKCITSQKRKGVCTSHSVKEEYLLKTIKESLKAYLEQKIGWEELYKLENKKYITAEGYRKELTKIEGELQKINNQFEVMYSNKINGVVNYRSFESLMRALKKKQQFLIMKKRNVEYLIAKNDDEARKEYIRYKEKVDKILYFKDIDADIIEALVDKILVSENKKLKEKRVDVYYKFKKE